MSLSEATKDLPDPLEDASATAPVSPDDLVAKMADDEIDRLIADAENGAPLTAPQAENPRDLIDEFEKQLPQSVPSDFGLPPDVPAASETAPTADAKSGSDAELQSQLDSLFTTLENELPNLDAPQAAEPVAEPLPEPAVEVPSAATLPMPPPVDVPADIANDDGHAVEPELDTSPDKLPDTLPDADAALRSDVKALLDDAVHQAQPAQAPKLIVVPLRLLNAPFASLSDEKRDIIGQIAIVTLVNALAIMLYVIIFRRP